MANYCANPGRGTHKMSERSTQAIVRCRTDIAQLINAKNYNRVVFTKNCTEAINQLLYGYLTYGDHVLVSNVEHNAVMRPLWHLRQSRNVRVNYFSIEKDGSVNEKGFLRSITSRTKLIICMLSSNVTGRIHPIREIGHIAQEKGIPFLVDGAQGLGTVDVNVEDDGISMLAFPGHKSLYGPQGTGGFWVDNEVRLIPLIKGGTGVNSIRYEQGRDFPQEYESGTLNVPGLAGLSKGIEFINSVGIERIRSVKCDRVKSLLDGFSAIKGVELLSEEDVTLNSGIVAININNLDSRDTAKMLDLQYDIAVRGGLHCAPQVHRVLGTEERGCVRFSPSFFTSQYEVEKCIKAVSEIAEKG